MHPFVRRVLVPALGLATAAVWLVALLWLPGTGEDSAPQPAPATLRMLLARPGDDAGAVGALAPELPGAAAPRTLAGFPVRDEPGCQPTLGGRELQLVGRCRLELDHAGRAVRVTTRQDTLLHRTAEGVQLIRGAASFEVRHLPQAHPPWTVTLPGGRIEVTGTRFEVTLHEWSCAVELHEGAIRVRHDDGRIVNLVLGQRYTWNTPDRAVFMDAVLALEHGDSMTGERPHLRVAPSRATDAPRPARQVAPGRRAAEHQTDRPVPAQRAAPPPAELPAAPASPSAESFLHALQRLALLRAQGRYAEALQSLEDLARRAPDARTAEALSFERGEILGARLGHTEQACRHWAEHLDRFGSGPSHSEVSRITRALGCP